MAAQRDQAQDVLTFTAGVLVYAVEDREHRFSRRRWPETLRWRQRHTEAAGNADPRVIVLKPRNGLIDQIADAVVILNQRHPVHAGIRQGGFRHARDDSGF